MVLKNTIAIYSCPACKRDVAAGELINLKVTCTFCSELVVMDVQDDTQAEGKKALKRIIKSTFGYDNLALDQMHSNRPDAMKAGHNYYFTGQPCKHGHIAPRNKRAECQECCRLLAKFYAKPKKKKNKTA
jgi:hypothetical protein